MNALTPAVPLAVPASYQRVSAKMLLGSIVIFSCFFPYPAVSIGASTGLQVSQVIAIVMIPFVVGSSFSRRALICFWAIVTPLAVSTTVLSLIGLTDSAELAVKSILDLVLSVVVIIPTSWILLRYGLNATLVAASAATLFHAALGGWQILAFASGSFPFLEIYSNPSFASLAEAGQRIALYDPRPFGWFPEPSAMAASLGPWLVILVSVAVRPRQLAAPLSRPARWFMTIAAVAGLALMTLSRSGYVLFILFALAIAGLGALKGHITSLVPGRNLLILGGAMIVAGLAAYQAYNLTGSRLLLRLESATGTSYEQRLTSILHGISLVSSNAATIVFGVGAGQSGGLLQRVFAGSSGAIYSDGLRYAIEGGLLGLLALLGISVFSVQSVMRSRARLTGIGCLVAWQAGVIFTTSYLSLSPIWAFLGVLLCWDQLFPPEPVARALGGVTDGPAWSPPRDHTRSLV